MSRGKDLAFPCDVVFHYDGGFDGFLCCVHESVYSKQQPFDIVPVYDAQPTLLETRIIETDREKAMRVKRSIVERLSPRIMDLLETVFLSCLDQRELAMLRFVLLAYRDGPGVIDQLGHPLVSQLLKAEQHLLGERHLLLGFVRFADYDGKLVSVITPKNFILPFLVSHFTARFSCEDFMIYDKTHRAALIYENRSAKIVPLEIDAMLPLSETELLYQALWKQFYNTIAIEARYNPKCRMTHIPKRYWENMPEMRELL